MPKALNGKISSLKLVMPAVAAFLLASPAPADATNNVLWGLNGHPVHNPVFADYDKQFEIMHENHLTTYRMDVDLTQNSMTDAINQTRILVGLAKKWGITLRPVLAVPFTWGDRTDSGHYSTGDAHALYQQGYDRTYQFVSLFKNDIQDWEMENELNLLVTNASGKRLYGYGWNAKEFDTPLMLDWAYVLRGMADAIAAINTASGTHLQRILGTTSTNFGFIDYMVQHGVNYEIVGYHYYVPLSANPHQSWSLATKPFDLFAQLARYGKPVHFTEVNAAEIYDAPYKNQESDGYTQKGYQCLNEQLSYLKNQTDMNLQEVDVYDFLDDPTQKPPENRFGVMYDLNTPKKALSILASFAAP